MLCASTFGDLRRGHNRGERAAVADAFGHGDDVGNDALRFESPEMRAGAAEAGLHFVGDANAARGADMFVSVLEIAVAEKRRSRRRPGSIRR